VDESAPDQLSPRYGILGLNYTTSPFYFDGYSVESSASYDVVDFEAGYNLQLGKVDVRLFGGARFAQLDQDIISHLLCVEGRCRATEQFDGHQVDFTGAGVRLGADVGAQVSGPIGIIASASGSALFGEQKIISTRRVISRGSIKSSRVVRHDDRTTWNVDGALGVTFNHEMDKALTLIFTLGYRAEAWFDVNNTQSVTPSRSPIIYGTAYADQIFHGPFLRGEWRFK